MCFYTQKKPVSFSPFRTTRKDNAMTNLELPTVKDIEKSQKDIVSGFKFNIRPSEHLPKIPS